MENKYSINLTFEEAELLVDMIEHDFDNYYSSDDECIVEMNILRKIVAIYPLLARKNSCCTSQLKAGRLLGDYEYKQKRKALVEKLLAEESSSGK